MRRNELTLRVLRTQVQFEIVQLGAAVGQAAILSRRAQRQLTVLEERCESTAGGMRAVLRRPLLDLSLLRTMRHLYQAERQAAHTARQLFASAQTHERRARDALASSRHRERAIERALKVELRKHELKRQAADLIHADDAWLQLFLRVSSS